MTRRHMIEHFELFVREFRNWGCDVWFGKAIAKPPVNFINDMRGAFWMPRLELAPWVHRITVMVVLLAASQVCLSTNVSAQDAEPGVFTKAAQTLNPTNWKMPSAPKFRLPAFLVPNEDQDRIVQRKDSLFTDVKTTASKSWQRTKETFNPARLNPMNMFAGNTTAPKTAEPESPGFFGSLFGAPKAASGPEERVANVNDFLGLDRP